MQNRVKHIKETREKRKKGTKIANGMSMTRASATQQSHMRKGKDNNSKSQCTHVLGERDLCIRVNYADLIAAKFLYFSSNLFFA